jgi:DNA-binding SARP family transcriptional activator
VLLALAALLALVALALIWEMRPAFPALPKDWLASMSAQEGQDALFSFLWIVLEVVLFLLAYGFAEEIRLTVEERREAEIAAFAARVLPKPPPAPPPPSRPAYADKYVLTLAPRKPPEAATAIATAEREQTRLAHSDGEAPAEHKIHISLLGPLSITGAEHTGNLRSAGEQLIAYLALHPRGARRDELTEAIWPAEDPKRSRQSLWQNISEIRSLLGNALIADRAHYALDRRCVTVDIEELELQLAEAEATQAPVPRRQSLERALRLFRGQPLAGFDQLWADPYARNLQATHAELLEQVGHARLAAGDARGALQAAEQGLDVDNLNEGLWRLAMQAESQLGLRESVGQRYEQLQRLLDEQVGLQPEGETRALYRELLGQR